MVSPKEGESGFSSGSANSGTGTVEIVSSAFEGQARVQRHRLVNQALGDLLKAQVHALAIKAKAPGETV